MIGTASRFNAVASRISLAGPPADIKSAIADAASNIAIAPAIAVNDTAIPSHERSDKDFIACAAIYILVEAAIKPAIDPRFGFNTLTAANNIPIVAITVTKPFNATDMASDSIVDRVLIDSVIT